MYEIAMAAGRRQLELEGGTEDEKQKSEGRPCQLFMRVCVCVCVPHSFIAAAALLDILDNAYLDALEEAERDRPEEILVVRVWEREGGKAHTYLNTRRPMMLCMCVGCAV